MMITRQARCNCKIRRRCFIAVILVFILSGCAVSLLLPAFVIVNLSNIHRNIIFTRKTVYFLNSVAYDFYSTDELNNRSGPGLQWKIFPLPNEQIPANISPWIPNNKRNTSSPVGIPVSSQTSTGLVFVDHIYIVTRANLTDRQGSLAKSLARYHITNYEWRMKWTRKSCNALENREEVYKKLNPAAKRPVDERRAHRQCAVTMEHIDIWHDIVARNSSLALILEDDAVFVPNFREKFDRTIYTAIRTGALKIGGLGNCMNNKSRLSTHSNEWYEQDPMIVIGTCFHVHDDYFAKNQRDASPMLSTHKDRAGRCSHAYLLTACSAQAIIRQTATQKSTVLDADIFLDIQVARSPTIQSFWLDPPIVYQGNQISDLDDIPSFKQKTH